MNPRSSYFSVPSLDDDFDDDLPSVERIHDYQREDYGLPPAADLDDLFDDRDF